MRQIEDKECDNDLPLSLNYATNNINSNLPLQLVVYVCSEITFILYGHMVEQTIQIQKQQFADIL